MSTFTTHELKTRFAIPAAILFLLALGLSFFGHDISYSIVYVLCASLVGGVFLFEYHRAGLPSWRAGAPLLYFLAIFVLPTFQQALGISDLTAIHGAKMAMAVCALGVISCSLGARAYETLTQAKESLPASPFLCWLERMRLQSMPAVTLFVLIGAAAQLWSVNYGYFGLIRADRESYSTLAGSMSTLGMALDVGSIAAWLMYFRKVPIKRYWLFLAVLSLVAQLAFGLFANSKWFLLKPVLIAAVTYYSARGSISLPMLTGALAFFFLFAYPFISSLRSAFAYGGITNVDALTFSIDHLLSLDWMFKNSLDDLSSRDEAFLSLGRGLFVTLATIVSDAGESVSYTFGATFLLGLETLIPRVLWSDKPDANIGNFIAQYYGIISSEDKITNVSPTLIGEFYMNFGLLGVLCGLFLWGMVGAWVDKWLVGRTAYWMGPFMFLGLTFHESGGLGPIQLVKAIPILLPLAYLISFFVTLSRKESTHQLIHRSPHGSRIRRGT